jgi:hypothetical protein
MSNLWKRYNGWRSRRQQLSLERWAQERAKGKRHYVLRQAFFFAVLMTAFRDIHDQFFDDGGRVHGLAFYLIQYAIFGVFVGYCAWWSREGEYKNAQLKRRLQTPLDDRILPR